MFHIFQEEKIITAFMMTFFGISIIMRVFLGLIYQRMIREADNMAATENKLLKQCKLKFAHCYQLGNGVANIPVFVDKFLNRLSLGPLSFETMYHFSGQAMLLSVVCAGFGICRSILNGRILGEILPFYIVSFFGLYLYFSVSAIVDIKGKKRVLKVNLVDYLENHLSARINMTENDLEMLYGDSGYGNRRQKRAGALPNKGRMQNQGRRTVELMPIGGRIPGEEQRVYEKPSQVSEEELEELLRDFFA